MNVLQSVAALMLLSGAENADQVSLTVLEKQLRRGAITPEEAVTTYCASETTDKQMDAFCACPEDAIRMLRERLNSPLTN